MTESVFIRVNGCGNAWPVFLGEDHPFYNRFSSDDLGSASYSMIGCSTKSFSTRSVDWEIVIDAGHNTVPFLLKNENRIPEAVLLTHGHLDHILGTDWIAQSCNFSQRGKKLPLYATNLCWQQVLQTIPHIKPAVKFHELKPGTKIPVSEVDGLFVNAFPVYHGDGARGAVMLLLSYKKDNIFSYALFTGDMVFPFLRNDDYAEISKAQVLYIDCSNRYCYPLSNHIGFTGKPADKNALPDYAHEWKKNNPLKQIVEKQIQHTNDPYFKDYFEDFLQQYNDYKNIPFTIIDFINKSGIRQINLVHYSGYHDKKYYGENVMNSSKLKKWAKNLLPEGFAVNVPKTGNITRLV
jgi:hypothetical protein